MVFDSNSTTALGTPFGAIKPIQLANSKPGKLAPSEGTVPKGWLVGGML